MNPVEDMITGFEYNVGRRIVEQLAIPAFCLDGFGLNSQFGIVPLLFPVLDRYIPVKTGYASGELHNNRVPGKAQRGCGSRAHRVRC